MSNYAPTFTESNPSNQPIKQGTSKPLDFEKLAKEFSQLNPNQQQAVTTSAKHILILAGAGSGKTKVLTGRMAHLVAEQQASIYEMMAVTFTNKAAKEMQHRLAGLIQQPLNFAYIGTFHGLCHRFLRQHYEKALLPSSFQILDIQDQQTLIKRVMKQHNISTEHYPVKQVGYFINQQKDAGLRANAVTASYGMQRALLDIYALYEQTCFNEGLVDFAELLLRCDELWQTHPELLEGYQQRFKHILIDEFQDTNNLQYRWLQRFANPNTSFFAVGDDDQSIYAFRGAKVDNMHHFAKHFQANLIKLEQNYRSTKPILDCANQLIDYNTNRLGKCLFTAKSEGDLVKIYSALNQDQEAVWISQTIQQLAINGVPLKQIAILYRSNAQSRTFEHTFFQYQIPYKVFGGLRFFERAEIKNALAYLQLIEDINQNTALERVINFPPRGIGPKSLEQLQFYLQDANQKDYVSAYSACKALGGKLAQFANLIDAMTYTGIQLNLTEFISFVLEKSGLIAHYQQDKEDESRLDNLKELISAASIFQQEQSYADVAAQKDVELGFDLGKSTPLRQFLNYAALESGDNQSQETQAVQMMTIHASKGLEFEHVFITGLEEGLFPNYASQNDTQELEEERRLMYVAITRAKQQLYISSAESRMLYGNISYNKISRFVGELPDSSVFFINKLSKSNNKSFNQSAYKNNYRKDDYDTNQRRGYAEKQTETTNNSNGVTKARINKVSKTGSSIEQMYAVGQQVYSKKFGEGLIESIQGEGSDAMATIFFKKYGRKILNLELANLS